MHPTGEGPQPNAEELFIGPERVRVIVHSAEERDFWLKAHAEETAKHEAAQKKAPK